MNAMHEQQPGIVFDLKIDLPYEGWITVKAVTLYRKPDFGFAARFVDIPAETAARLKRALQQLKEQGPHRA